MLFTDFKGYRWLRPSLLQPGLHHQAGEEDREVQVQIPLVLLRGVRGVCEGRPDLHLQLEPGESELQSAVRTWISGGQAETSQTNQ